MKMGISNKIYPDKIYSIYKKTLKGGENGGQQQKTISLPLPPETKKLSKKDRSIKKFTQETNLSCCPSGGFFRTSKTKKRQVS